MFDGLSLCWNKGFKHVILETDAQEVLQLFSSLNPSFSSLSVNLLHACRNLLTKEWDIQMKPARREINLMTDCLAKKATTQV